MDKHCNEDHMTDMHWWIARYTRVYTIDLKLGA